MTQPGTAMRHSVQKLQRDGGLGLLGRRNRGLPAAVRSAFLSAHCHFRQRALAIVCDGRPSQSPPFGDDLKLPRFRGVGRLGYYDCTVMRSIAAS